ncbi:hypothetical protein FNV43_RR20885 [Rhamnella rubrinervis]|uniref:Uncharacterized protein n=1 Tax=Rhamnella rubrinervis TaxID=2594499 RepID=A0A8K0GTU4_9ROSA|nr:hypothetical protein FNV43_RR20885 [Rhamnella rubrinervis]
MASAEDVVEAVRKLAGSREVVRIQEDGQDRRKLLPGRWEMVDRQRRRKCEGRRMLLEVVGCCWRKLLEGRRKMSGSRWKMAEGRGKLLDETA